MNCLSPAGEWEKEKWFLNFKLLTFQAPDPWPTLSQQQRTASPEPQGKTFFDLLSNQASLSLCLPTCFFITLFLPHYKRNLFAQLWRSLQISWSQLSVQQLLPPPSASTSCNNPFKWSLSQQSRFVFLFDKRDKGLNESTSVQEIWLKTCRSLIWRNPWAEEETEGGEVHWPRPAEFLTSAGETQGWALRAERHTAWRDQKGKKRKERWTATG